MKIDARSIPYSLHARGAEWGDYDPIHVDVDAAYRYYTTDDGLTAAKACIKLLADTHPEGERSRVVKMYITASQLADMALMLNGRYIAKMIAQRLKIERNKTTIKHHIAMLRDEPFTNG